MALSVTIVTRSGKGSALTAAEHDTNLANLQEAVEDHVNAAGGADTHDAADLTFDDTNVDFTADDIQEAIEDLETQTQLEEQAPPEAAFMARAKARRDATAGSGFLAWGDDTTGWTAVNNSGLSTLDTPDGNLRLMLGSVASSPVANVHGHRLKLAGIGHATYNYVTLPAASSSSSVLDRDDLVFLEVWHELISDKDFVYPLGNVQNLATTHHGISLVDGSFSGYDTYSLMGDWQTAEDIVGKGKVWSTMSDANKRAFLADPDNNIYLNEDGDLTQVRYRVRVVEGPGAGWSNLLVTLTGSMAWLYSGSSDYVIPKGKQVTITADLGSSPGGGLLYYNITQASSQITGYPGAVAVSAEGTGAAYNALCFALPLALISRRNQGAFHPVYNPNGCAKCLDDDGTTPNYWYACDRTYASAADCFTYASGGDVSSGVSGRPDGRYHDHAYNQDVQDLRNEARRAIDLDRLLEREARRMVAATFRGWEGEWDITEYESGTLDSEAYASAAWGETATALTFTGEELGASVGSTSYLDPAALILIEGDSQYYRAVRKAVSGGNTTVYLHPLHGDARGDFTTTSAYKVLAAARSSRTRQKCLACDIIGDPAQYDADWQSDGHLGRPLLVDETGGDYLPDASDTVWKLSRKAPATPILVVKNGAAFAASGNWSFSTTTNAITFTSAPVATDVIEVYYEHYGSAVTLAAGAEVLALGRPYLTNTATETVGSVLASWLTGKTPAGSNSYAHADPAWGYGLGSDGKLNTSAVRPPRHTKAAGDLLTATTDPGVKVLPHLTREYGRLYLQIIFKELRYTSAAWQDDEAFQLVDYNSTTTDDDSNVIVYGQARAALPVFVATED